MKTLNLRSYAKINLSLDVTGVRPDGYHEVTTVMQKISLYDELRFRWEKAGRTGEIPGFQVQIRTNRPYLPTDERNLVYRAAMLMADYGERQGLDIKGVFSADITKHIPVSAGMAGGSGNAAAAMIALNRMWRLGLNTRELCRMGSSLGADVPFCILVQNTSHKVALGTGTGEELTTLGSRFRSPLVAAKPGFGVSTREVYRGLDSCGISKHPDTEAMIAALRSGEKAGVLSNMVNVLENYTLTAYPQVAELKEIMASTAHIEQVMMSGSGPTVLGFYPGFGAAKRACAYLRSLGYEAYWAQTAK